MIITCPDCQTRYKTTADAIGPNGRMVRCASCSSTWFVAAESDTLTMDSLALADIEQDAARPAVQPVVPKPPMGERAGADTSSVTDSAEPEPARSQTPGAHVEIRERTDRKRRNARLRGVLAIWLVPLALLGGAAYGAYHFRSDIVKAVPKSATLYKAMGIEVSATGITLSRPETRYAEVDGRPTLIVTGSVFNGASESVAMPRVALSLHNAAGESVAEWQVEMEASRLPAGARAEYLSQYNNPAMDAVELRSRLADMGATSVNTGTQPSAPISTPVEF